MCLARCSKLWNSSSSKKNVKRLERLKGCVGGGMLEPRLVSLPKSLRVLDLNDCGVGDKNDVDVVFHAQSSSFNLFLNGNPFEHMPKNIDLYMLRELTLDSCDNLKSLLFMPSTLKVLSVDWCRSLERITFQSGRFSLDQFSCEGCFNLSEVQGLFELVPLAKIDRAVLRFMDWIKAFENHKVNLDVAGTTSCRPIQVLQEYGIRSTYLVDVGHQRMTPYEDQQLSSTIILRYHVPFIKEKFKIQGFGVSCMYKSSSECEDKDTIVLWIRIINKSKGLSWLYNPLVHCKPDDDEDVLWLSYWPIGNILDAGDELIVAIGVENGMIQLRECGLSPVYGDTELKKEELCENGMIGGDLSEFEVTPGSYYLCRRDFFGLETSACLKKMFNDTVDYPESQGWRKSLQSETLRSRMTSYKSDDQIEVVLQVRGSIMNSRKIWRMCGQGWYWSRTYYQQDMENDDNISKIWRMCGQLEGWSHTSYQGETQRLTVIARSDPAAMVRRAWKIDSTIKIVSVRSIDQIELDKLTHPTESEED